MNREQVIEIVKKAKENNERADLRCEDLRGADLRGADLRGADLQGADLQGADLRCEDLQGADLSGADLRGADLQGADLSGADLSGAYLRGANLSRADLSRADLSGADLRCADLQGADLPRRCLQCTVDDERNYPVTYYAAGVVKETELIHAGCRLFTYEEALSHWGSDDYPNKARGAKYVATVKFLHSMITKD